MQVKYLLELQGDSIVKIKKLTDASATQREKRFVIDSVKGGERAICPSVRQMLDVGFKPELESFLH